MDLTLLPRHNISHVPPFESRDIDAFSTACQYIKGVREHGCNWVASSNVSAALGFNGYYAAAPVGGINAPSFPPGTSATVMNLLADGTPECEFDQQRRVPCKPLALAHPEWFVCLNGSRTDPAAVVWPCRDLALMMEDKVQPCWSNQALLDVVTSNVRRVLKANSAMTHITVEMMDGGYLTCPADFAASKSPAGAYFAAINHIAANVSADFPRVGIMLLAYQASQVPPPAGFTFHPSVIVRVAINAAAGRSDDCSQNDTPIGGCALPLSKPLSDAANNVWTSRIKSWRRACSRVYVWHYLSNFQYTIAPQPNYLLNAEDIEIFASLGVTGYFGEMASDIGEEAAALKTYVIGHKLLDPSQDTRGLVAKFATGFYSEAAAASILRYITLMDVATRARGGYRPGVARQRANALEGNYEWGPYAAAFSNATMIAAATALTEAQRAVRATQLYRFRVDLLLMSVQYVMLVRWNEIRASSKTPTQWPLHNTLDEELEAFALTFNRSGLSKNGDDGHGHFQGSVTGSCRFGCPISLSDFVEEVRQLNPQPAPAPPPPPAPPVSNVQLTVSPPLVASGSWVNVSWSDIPAAELARNTSEDLCVHDGDCHDVRSLSLFIGVFPKGWNRSTIGPQGWPEANPPWTATSPMKWKPLDTSAGTLTFFMEATSAAQLEFVLFANGTSWPIELASTVLNFTDGLGPMHLRLARTAKPHEIRVSFSAAAYDPDAVVQWGYSPGNYTHSTSAEASTYRASDMCGPPATTHGFWPTPFFFTAVVVVGGPVADMVYYRVGSANMGFSLERAFVAPSVPAAEASLRFVVMGDVGETYVDGAQYHWMEPYAINTTDGALHPDRDAKKGLLLLPLALNTGGQGSGKTGPPRGRVLSSLRSAVRSAVSLPFDLVLHLGDLAYVVPVNLLEPLSLLLDHLYYEYSNTGSAWYVIVNTGTQRATHLSGIGISRKSLTSRRVFRGWLLKATTSATGRIAAVLWEVLTLVASVASRLKCGFLCRRQVG